MPIAHLAARPDRAVTLRPPSGPRAAGALAGGILARCARHLAQGVAEVALPATCVACRALTWDDEPLCELCARSVEAIVDACPRCGLPLPAPAAAVPAPCLACQRAAPPWQSARAPFAFAGQLAHAIRRFKLAPDVGLARPLARLLAPALARSTGCDAFVPVPLHPARLRRREFNQASLLARAARRRGQPPVFEALDRLRDTPSQSTLAAAARRANLRGAFAVGARDRERVRGTWLCLVDDVLTTGATASECAETLLAAGARRVDVLTLARTLP